MNKANPQKQLKPVDFTEDPRVQHCLLELQAFTHEKPLIVSDVIDKEGRQYVNLVQKGGGVLGIALVGYTYVLEQMGIRFLRLAGTSAGAINTALMTVIGKKEDAKSEEIINELCNLSFFSFVDGHPAARTIIKRFITNKHFGERTKNVFSMLAGFFVLLLALDFIFLGLQHYREWAVIATRLTFLFTGLYALFLGVLFSYGSSLLKRLKNSGFGINPGDAFYDWIKGLMKKNGVSKVSELNAKASQLPEISLRIMHEKGLEGLKGDVTFITSEIVSQNKIQFPLMCPLFRKPAEIDSLQPAGFVRASMAIPIFFESYYINDIPVGDTDVKKAWKEFFDEEHPPETARFVDGGVLSNFPINLFYNPDIRIPRLPTFGIDLDDSKAENKQQQPAGWSLGGYFGRLFNTIRYYYDKDFLVKNKLMQKGIGKVHLEDYNWLNFFLSDKDKIDMFVKGAEAATVFLKNFNWEEYKAGRTEVHDKVERKNPSI